MMVNGGLTGLQYLQLKGDTSNGDLLRAAPTVSLDTSHPFRDAGGLQMISVERNQHPSFEKLRYLFDIPNIRGLVAFSLDFKHIQRRDLAPEDRAATSNITSLCLPCVDIPPEQYDNFKEMLGWPVALEAFHMSNSGAFAPPPPPDTILQALAPHQTSLKQLFIETQYNFSYTALKPLNLHKLYVLKILGLPRKYLETASNEQGQGWQTLPPRLEELQIQLTETFDYAARGASYMSSRQAVEFVKWLRELADLRKTVIPRLSNVVIIHNNFDVNGRGHVADLECMCAQVEGENKGLSFIVTESLQDPAVTLSALG